MLFYLDNWQSADPDAQNARPQRRPGAGFFGRPGRNRRIGARVPMPPADAAESQRAERAAAEARPERELRARADGAAHARRRRRLHAAGRDQRGARLHRLDHHRAAPGRQLPVRAADPRRAGEDRARPEDQGRRRRSRTARRCSTSSRSIPRPRRSSRPSWRAGSSPTRRRPRSSSAPRRVPRDRRRHPRGGADDRHVAGVLLGRGLPREGQEPVRVRRLGRPRDRHRGRRRDAAGAGACGSSACRSTCASRRPGIPDKAEPGSTPARC